MTPEENIENLIRLIQNQSDMMYNSFIVAVENLDKSLKDLEQMIEEAERRLEEHDGN